MLYFSHSLPSLCFPLYLFFRGEDLIKCEILEKSLHDIIMVNGRNVERKIVDSYCRTRDIEKIFKSNKIKKTERK